MKLEYPDSQCPFDPAELMPEGQPASPEESAPAADVSPEVIPAEPGNWRYGTSSQSRLARVPWAAMAVSASLHALGLLAFNQKEAVKPKHFDEPLQLALMALPKIEEEPDDLLPELGDKSDLLAGLDVPRLADVPTTVVLDGAFTQRFDYSSLIPNAKEISSKLSSIPALIRPGGAGGMREMKDIFNLSELDRPPVAVYQPTPALPYELKRLGGSAQMVVEFIVSSSGEVINARVLRTTNSTFDDVAVKGVMKWKFRPGIKRGRAVNTRIHQPMTINVDSD